MHADMHIIILLIIGAAAGFLATRFMKFEASVIATVAIGVLGALIGGMLLRFGLAFLGAGAGFIGAVLGAMALIWVYQRFLRGPDDS